MFFSQVGQKMMNETPYSGSQKSMNPSSGKREKTIVIPKISKEDFERQKKAMEDQMNNFSEQFVKKSDVIDILDNVKKEVNFEMRLQMRKIADDLKFEREKKKIEEEMRKKHFESYFTFLLEYYQ